MLGDEPISKAFFELRVRSPNKPKMPINNRRHLEYIGERRGVLIGHGASHGVFGFINGKPAEETGDVKELGKYIEDKTKIGTHVYRIILSLSEADAVRVGYDNYETWEELIKTQMPMIADKVGIKTQDLEYGAGVHMKKGNPHCHIMFWDKNQKVKSPFVHWKISNGIRHEITKEIYKEEIARLYHMKNEARTAIIGATDDFFKDFLSSFADMSDKELLQAVDELKSSPDHAESGIIYNRFSNKELAELAQNLFELKGKLPKSGRLNMKLLPPETKEDVKDFAKKLLSLNVDCKREFDRYVYATTEIASFYVTDKNLPKAKENAEDDMLYRLCNKILSEMKGISKMEWDAKSYIKEAEWKKQLTISLITEVFGFLSRYGHAEENMLRQLVHGGSLSKQAKKEYALQQQNISDTDWER